MAADTDRLRARHAEHWRPPARNLSHLMHRTLSTQGHAPFLTYYDDISGERTELSYATFDNWVGKTANLLAEEFNAGQGTRVALAVGAHWTAVVAAFACWRVGACVVPVTPDARVEAQLEHTAPDVVVAWEDVAERLRGPVIAIGAGFGGRLTRGVAGALGYGDEVLAFADDYDDTDVTLHDPALLVVPYSGVDAGIVLDQTSLLAAALALGAWGLTADDRLLTTDLAPVEGLVLGLLGPFAAGAAAVLVRNLDPATFGRKVRDERVTWALPSATVLDELPVEELGGLRGFLCPSGAPLAVRDRIEAESGLPVLGGHGIATATCASALEPADLDGGTRAWLAGRGGRSAGVATANAEVAERDGELCVRGPVVMAGHDRRPDLDDAAFAGGWLHTGESGRVERAPDGREYVIVG